MSQSFKLAKAKLSHVIKSNKSNQSTSSFGSGLVVGDSYQTLRALVTNVATGALFGLIGLAMFSIVAVFGGDDVSATASSITITPSSVSTYVNIPPTSEGKFAATGTVTYGITTTHASGYTASVTATDLSFVDNSVSPNVTYTIDPLANGTAITAEQFAASTGTAYTNKWGYLPATYYDETGTEPVRVINNDKYFPAPIGTTQKLDETSIANPSTPNNYDITVGARVDHTIEQGQYTTTITVSAVGNPTPYSITYNANAGTDIVNNMPPTNPQTGSIEGETVNLAPNAPVRNNYFFNGWCTVATTVDGVCSGTTYYGNEEYSLDQTASTNELTLYAMWNTSTCAGKTKLHDLVTCQVKTNNSAERTQTLSDMQAVITGPITGDPSTDTSNSGVYKYDADYYGIANDNPDSALNTEDIYYFRGILDSTFASIDTYGGIPSTGDSAYYHNFVRLHDPNSDKADTCWRIVRTTATGGTKMVYNGAWSSENNTCANAKNNVAAINAYYNQGKVNYGDDAYGTSGFVTYAGYNYNSQYAYNNTQYTAAVNNSELFNNETPSNIRMQTEKWYTDDSNLTKYALNDKLETSAGWCNDRTTQANPSFTNTTIPYKTSNDWVSFGPTFRNTSFDTKLSLTCPNVTGHDLLAPANGLSYPLALLTRDETSLIGHGRSDEDDNPSPFIVTKLSSNYSFGSYLRSGTSFWLLSPYTRNVGTINNAQVTNDGRTRYARIIWDSNIRPTISLASGTTVTGGTGTSTDPWIVEP